MELSEAYKKIEISSEEKSSIERYMGFKHTSINILSDLTPERYQALSNSGWKLPETEDEIKDAIADFVNLYSAMYKESKGRGLRRNLIRGTSISDAEKMHTEVRQILSTTTDEEIAKRFCKYGDAALVRFNVEQGVPFLMIEDYRDENSATENEVILAPFCKVTKNELTSKYNGYNYYSISISKPELTDMPEEQIKATMEEVINGFTQNTVDMKDYMDVLDRYEILSEKLNKDFGDIEEKEYYYQKKQETFDEYSQKRKVTYGFKEKLRSLLKGLCRQKELEIDKAQETIDLENERIAEEERKRIEDEQRQKEVLAQEEKKRGIYLELSSKTLRMPAEAQDLQTILQNTYQSLLKIEANNKELAARLGVSYTNLISTTDISKQIEQIQENIRVLQEKANEVNFSENDSLESIENTWRNSIYAFDGISYGLEVARDIPQVISMYQNQSDKEIKKNLYFKVQNAIQEARVEKYLKDRDTISKEGIGFFSGLTRKSDLQIERLNNVNLKIQLAQATVPEEQPTYSVRSMLADLYACATAELGGNFTTKMQSLYESMKSSYVDVKSGEFSDDYIGKLAREKLVASQKNLPVLQEPKTSFWGRRKGQIELLRLENKGLETQIAQARTRSSMNSYVVESLDAISFFDTKLKGVAFGTKDRSKEEKGKVTENTFELWPQN